MLTGHAAPVATASEVPQDPGPVRADTAIAPGVTAELASLHGGYLAHFVCVPKIYSYSFFFLAEVAALTADLQRLQEEAASPPNQDNIRIGCPANIGNLQSAMRLENNNRTYRNFRVSFFFFSRDVL